MSKWTHSLCDKCYSELEPGREVPYRVADPEDPDIQACCRCGEMHQFGIYYRADPSEMKCNGVHD